MEKELLTELCTNFNRLGALYQAVLRPEMEALLDELFSRKEAEIAAQMPPGSISAPDLAEKLSRPEAEITSLLESMAAKATVITREKDGVVRYALLPILPGIFEFQFMRGTDTEHDRRLARMFRAYLDIAEPLTTKKLIAAEEATAPTRIIPIEKTIQAGQTVYTFDQLSHYIDSAEVIALGHCYCRHQGYLLGEQSCDAPRETCMTFGPAAHYGAERGISRMITKAEAHAVLEDCERHGLVHLSSNTSEYLEFLCNCCSCHCDILRKIKLTDKPVWLASSGYLATVDTELCTSCGTCVEACQVEAVAMNGEEIAVVDQNRCIGCGACAHLCPEEAILMTPHPHVPSPPATSRDLRKAILKGFQLPAV